MEHHIGIDFHKQYSSVAVIDEKGSIVDEQTLYHTDMNDLINYFSSFEEGTPVALEATRNWYWLVDCLQELGLKVKLVHAKKARIIAESTIKTDKIDAQILAHLERCNFLPQAYIADKEVRSQRELLRYYMSLVKIRGSIKNRIHTILAKHNIHAGFSDLFGKAGITFLKQLELPCIFHMEMKEYLALLESLQQRIQHAQAEIKNRCQESPYARRLKTIPGIAHFTGLLLAAEIADIKRFKNYKKLCAYAGLSSTIRQSADKIHHGHINKNSNKYIRYVLIEAVPKAIKKDPELYSFYMKVLRKRGRNRAKIAVARKLLISIYFMLRDDCDYHLRRTNYISRVNPRAKLGA